jgi:hypothetical protein
MIINYTIIEAATSAELAKAVREKMAVTDDTAARTGTKGPLVGWQPKGVAMQVVWSEFDTSTQKPVTRESWWQSMAIYQTQPHGQR